jgi:PadR family transcriptional regulator
MFMDDKGLYSGLIRFHILRHSAERFIHGSWIAEELALHGYNLNAGTIYPTLHSLKQKGYLKSSRQRSGGLLLRVYHGTPLGREALRTARKRVRELLGEMFETN